MTIAKLSAHIYVRYYKKKRKYTVMTAIKKNAKYKKNNAKTIATTTRNTKIWAKKPKTKIVIGMRDHTELCIP